MSRVRHWVGVGLMLPALAFASPQDIQDAMHSVYRVWQGVPLPKEFMKQTDTASIQQLQTQQFAENVVLKGISLSNKNTQNRQELGGTGVVFQHGETPYLLVATGSAYAVSNKGHLLTLTRFADNTAATQAVFTDHTGWRDVGEQGGKTQLFVLQQKPNSPQLVFYPTQLLAHSAEVALLQSENLPTKLLPIADPQFAKTADVVHALGVEGLSDQLAGKRGKIDRVDYLTAISHDGKLDKKIKQNNMQIWLHSADVSGSLNGGALVNECGQVVGMNWTANKQNTAISGAQVAELLRKHSVPFKQYQGRCGGVVAQAENIADGATKVVAAAQHNPRGWLAVLGLSLATLVACVIAWKLLRWAWRQRRQNRAIPHTVEHITPKKNHKNAVSGSLKLQTLSGNVNVVLPPNNQAIVLGRGAHCDVVLDNPKVSGEHARLRFDGKNVWVEDLNSTNGTLINGHAINQITQLNPNDVLQLSRDENVARFRLPENANRTFVEAQATSRMVAILQPLGNYASTQYLMMGQVLRIGRLPDNDVAMANQMQISAHHCQISVSANGTMMLQDLQSTNGTFVDNLNQRVTQCSVRVGQTIYLGDQQIAFRIQAA